MMEDAYENTKYKKYKTYCQEHGNKKEDALMKTMRIRAATVVSVINMIFMRDHDMSIRIMV